MVKFYYFAKKELGIFYLALLRLMEAKNNMLNIPQKYFCENCDYGCSKTSCWTQHLLTSKHAKAKNKLIKAKKEYFCDKCSIEFKHQSSFCRHKKNVITHHWL